MVKSNNTRQTFEYSIRVSPDRIGAVGILGIFVNKESVRGESIRERIAGWEDREENSLFGRVKKRNWGRGG